MSRIDLYAVVGDPVLHSLSPKIFIAAFESLNLKCTYSRLAASTAKEALSLAREMGMSGLNITSPFKEDMLPLMDHVDEDASEIGAVNTVVFEGGRARGYNTDPAGVRAMLVHSGVDIAFSKVAVLGAGGAARSALYALKRFGARDVLIINRTPDRAHRLCKKIGCGFAPLDTAGRALADVRIIIACWPKSVNALDASWLNSEHVILDANYGYSPVALAAKRAGCRYIDGSVWLLGQAFDCFELFIGQAPPREEMREALDSQVGQVAKGHIVLAGMMGSGKSRVGIELAEMLSLKFIDVDQEIERMAGKTIARIFAEQGEVEFRKLEERAVREAVGSQRSVIALGGGALMSDQNHKLSKSSGTIIWLWVPAKLCVSRASDGSRPLLDVDDPAAKARSLIEERFESYATASDMVLDTSERSPEQVARKIFDEISKIQKH